LLGVLAAHAVVRAALAQLARTLDAAFTLEVHYTVARAALETPGVAAVEDPAFADRVEAVQDAERRGVLRATVTALASVAVTRLRGAGAFGVLLGFAWWAPLVLAMAWHLTNVVDRRATENGVSVNLSDGAVRMRRAEYLRSLALEAPAAKELRVFGLGGWLVGQYGQAWSEALGVLWRSRRAHRGLTAAAVAALAASHALVLGALARAAYAGELGGAALLVFVQAAIATCDLGLIGDWSWLLAQALGVAGRVAGLRPGAEASIPPSALPSSVIPSSVLPSSATPPPRGPRSAIQTVSPPVIPAAASARAAGGARGPAAVRLDGVRFTYRGRERPTLDGVTLDVPPGQSLAIVGENGAGKSTLIKLLCGLYEPDGGRVTLDGAPPLRARGRVAAIFQDFVRYPLPLRENVGFGHLPSLGDGAALDRALRQAGGGRLPERLPRGWETVLSREFADGAELSGGQWQRVALARALAAVQGGAGLLVLDEPTASLDVRAEAELFERFLELTRGVTTVLVTHRLASVRHAERIVVVHGGRVVEDGSHGALMALGGRYAEMYALQAARFAAGADADSDADADAETGVGAYGEVADG
ncbi:ABC transporter ATP-binding protein, partial [Longimicrobium sp.]|uniref:ABC transporter ATP-binding protein n=1 Tax=Longimicrobium sp. TaxID=2029185 RepID=UPI002E34642B